MDGLFPVMCLKRMKINLVYRSADFRIQILSCFKLLYNNALTLTCLTKHTPWSMSCLHLWCCPSHAQDCCVDQYIQAAIPGAIGKGCAQLVVQLACSCCSCPTSGNTWICCHVYCYNFDISNRPLQIQSHVVSIDVPAKFIKCGYECVSHAYLITTSCVIVWSYGNATLCHTIVS